MIQNVMNGDKEEGIFTLKDVLDLEEFFKVREK